MSNKTMIFFALCTLISKIFCKTIPELRSVVNTRLRDFPVLFYDIEYNKTLLNFVACVS